MLQKSLMVLKTSDPRKKTPALGLRPVKFAITPDQFYLSSYQHAQSATMLRARLPQPRSIAQDQAGFSSGA